MTSHRVSPAEGTPAPGTPTQVAHPWKAVLRTFVAAAVGVVVAWLVRVLGVDLTALSQPIVDSLTATAWAGATGFAQWLLTRPGLQPALAGVGLGTGVDSEHGRRADRDGTPDGRDTPPAGRPLTSNEYSTALAEEMDRAGAAEDAYAADHPGVEGSELWDQDAETIDRYEKRAGIA